MILAVDWRGVFEGGLVGDVNAGGVDDEVFVVGAFGDGSGDGEEGEFLDAVNAFESCFEWCALSVDDLDGGDGLSDGVMVVTTNVPWS